MYPWKRHQGGTAQERMMGFFDFLRKKGKAPSRKNHVDMVKIPEGRLLIGIEESKVEEIIDMLINVRACFDDGTPIAYDRRSLIPFFEKQLGGREVVIKSYWIDKYPVTNEQYLRFCKHTGHPFPTVPEEADEYIWKNETFPEGKNDCPVVFVTYEDACIYASWRNARLPTEAEWEFAGRGREGHLYPWGNLWQTDNCNVNKKSVISVLLHKQNCSSFGVLGMSGNVWECTCSEYAPHMDGKGNVVVNEGVLVMKGGGFHNYIDAIACLLTNRSTFDTEEHEEGSIDWGFRCVVPIEE